MKMPLGTEAGLGPGDTVLDGDTAFPKKDTAPQFSAHVYCGQTTVCIRTPLGTDVGLNLGHIVRWGPSFPCPKGAQPPIFGQCPLCPNGWMD